MTEDEWLTKDAPRVMFEFVRPRASLRQLRYFGAACCRAVWDLLQDERLRNAVVCIEEYAAGATTKRELAFSKSQVRQVLEDLLVTRRRVRSMTSDVTRRPSVARPWESTDATRRTSLAAEAVRMVARPTEKVGVLGQSVLRAFDLVVQAQTVGQTVVGTHLRIARGHATALRCVFGNPFRAVVFDPSWRTDAARAFSQGAYQSRDITAAPILADALTDAGCEDEAVRGHLRGGGEHMRGCWCVDGVLGLD
ncbi:MAG TPA: hypothetical protein VH092_37460 [Urbifossiella sp.]|jgi:hypothetical protein|nr:hypothetical protein [Urbifossiella sp.]